MYRYDKHGLLQDQHPTKMPYYIVAAGLVITLAFGAAHAYKSQTNANADCDTASVPASEIVQGACNHPVPKP